MKAEEGWRCEGDAAPGPYSTNTARMLLPGTLGNSRSKIFETFDAGTAVSSAATFADTKMAPTSSSKAIFFTAISVDEGVSIRRGHGNPFAYIVPAIGGPK